MKKYIFLVLFVSIGFTSHVAVGSENSGKHKRKHRRRKHRRNSLSTPDLALIASAALEAHNTSLSHLDGLDDNSMLAATWSPQNINSKLNSSSNSNSMPRSLRKVPASQRVSRQTF